MGELRNGPVELAREPLGRVFTGRLDSSRELLDRRLREPVRRPVDDSAELIDLPPFDVGEAGLDPAYGFCLLGRDALAELALSLAQTLRDFVQGAPALGFVHFDLAAGRGPGLLRGAFEFFPELGQDRPLFLA